MAFTPGPKEFEFNNWYDTKFKPAMERGPLDKYVARQAWFAATNPLLARIAALEAQVEQAAQPVMMQFRWTNPGDNPSPSEHEMSWQEVTTRNCSQSLQDRIGELLAYEYNGRKCYEIRALYTAPPKAAALTDEPAQLQQLSEFEEGTLVIEHMGPSALAGGSMSLMDAFDKGLKVGQSALAAKNGVELK